MAVEIHPKKQFIEHPVKNKWGFNLKHAIREQAKKLPKYHEKISHPITVENEGKEIEVNTVGRWIFGVPSFAGRAAFMGGIKNKIVITTPLDKNGVVKSIFDKSVKALEVKNG